MTQPTSSSSTTPTPSPARAPRKAASAVDAPAKPARAAPAKKSAPKKKAASFEAPAEAEWHRLISEAAYYRAERRGFAAGHEHEDWVWAEEEVRRILSP